MDVAVSSNGQFMVSGRSSGPIQQSRDFGETWISGGPSGSCSAVAMTPDGRIQFAGIRGGKLYRSTDYGTNWTDLALVGDWTDAACSADGATVIFSSGTSPTSGFLATSWDAGSTWITEEQGQYWETASISADGRKAVAAVYSGWIYTNTFLPSHDVVEPRPPEITAQPVGVTTNLGGAVSLSVTAIQNVEGSMSYQWLKDGIALPGATSPVLTITNVQPPRIGDYQVVVGNAWGAVTSSVARLNIQGIDAGIWRGLVGYYPFNSSLADLAGGNDMLRIRITETTPSPASDFQYATTSADFVPGPHPGRSALDFRNRFGEFVRATNPDSGFKDYPRWTQSFWARSMGTNGWRDTMLLMGAHGLVTFKGGQYAGVGVLLAANRITLWGHADNYMPSLAEHALDATQWHHFTIRNMDGVVRLSVDGQWVAEADLRGEGRVFAPSIGDPYFHDEFWIREGGGLGGFLTLDNNPNGWDYRGFVGSMSDLRIYNRALSEAEVAALYASEVPRPPQITAQPVGVTTNLGGTVSLSVTAIQNVEGTMSYQWLKDGIALPGATNSVLVITNVQPTSFGDYEVAVGNALGSVTSQVASVRLQTTEDVKRVTLLDFNTDPSSIGLYREFGNGAADWRSTGGASGAVNDGYLSGNDAKGGQQWCLVFKDLDAGLVVKAFKFECDLRIGGGTSRPADGFSINYVRSGDDLLTNADNGIDPTFLNFAGAGGEEHLPEEGSLSGLGIGFDTWQSGNHPGGITDVVGISIRVDGELIAQMPVPLQPGNVWPGGVFDDAPYRNLSSSSPDYPKSMQTGALTTDEDLNGDGVVDANDVGLVPQPNYSDDPIRWAKWIKNLKWERFVAEFTEDARVKIRWKGFEVTPEGGLPVNYAPSPSRFVFAGRTGGAWEVHHIDNIAFTTEGSAVPSASATLSGLSIIGAGGGLSPAFDGATTNYAVVVRDVVDNVAVTPTASHGGATIGVRVNGGAFATVSSGSASMPLALQVGVNTIDVRVTAEDGVTALTYAVAVTRLSRFLTWKLDHYDSTANSGNSANDSISAGDGLTNLEKYAFGLDPKQPTPGGLVVSGNLITSRGKPVFSVVTTPTSVGMKARFVRRKSYLADGLKFTVQFSPDLASWQTSTAIPTVVASDADFEVVEVPYPLFVNGRKAGFFRVNVGLQP